jgi:hypothetical protein
MCSISCERDRAPCTPSGRRVAMEEAMLSMPSVGRCVDSVISSVGNIVTVANGTSMVLPN